MFISFFVFFSAELLIFIPLLFILLILIKNFLNIIIWLWKRRSEERWKEEKINWQTFIKRFWYWENWGKSERCLKMKDFVCFILILRVSWENRARAFFRLSRFETTTNICFVGWMSVSKWVFQCLEMFNDSWLSN